MLKNIYLLEKSTIQDNSDEMLPGQVGQTSFRRCTFNKN